MSLRAGDGGGLGGGEKREQPPALQVVLLESLKVTPGINRGQA